MTADPAVLLLVPATLGLLVVLALILRLFEMAFPRFSRWLDARFGEEGPE